MEAFEGYWGKKPSIKRLVFKSVPEATTRVAMLKRGEVDVAYLLDASLAKAVKDDPNLHVAFSGGLGTYYLDFFDMWDPKSPWHDERVRKAASLALDRKAISDAETLGASKPTGSVVIKNFEYAVPIEPDPYDPAQAKEAAGGGGLSRTGSTPATSTPGRPISAPARQSAAISARSASRRGSARWSAPPFTPRCRPRSCTASACASPPRRQCLDPPGADRAGRRPVRLWRLARCRQAVERAA